MSMSALQCWLLYRCRDNFTHSILIYICFYAVITVYLCVVVLPTTPIPIPHRPDHVCRLCLIWNEVNQSVYMYMGLVLLIYGIIYTVIWRDCKIIGSLYFECFDVSACLITAGFLVSLNTLFIVFVCRYGVNSDCCKVGMWAAVCTSELCVLCTLNLSRTLSNQITKTGWVYTLLIVHKIKNWLWHMA